MLVKTVINPIGQRRSFGRRRPLVQPQLRLKNYLDPVGLPTPPVAVDYTAKAVRALEQLYGNDRYGDCVIAMRGHVIGVLTGNAGQEAVFTDQQMIADYGFCGFVPGDPSTDQGCDEVAVLNHWKTPGFVDGHGIVGWVAVDGANVDELKAALWLFENLCFGVELPDAWVNPFPVASGFIWDVAGDPDPENGHAFSGCGYGPHGVKIATWGLLGTLTYAAIARYAVASVYGAVYTVLSHDEIARAQTKAPNGFNWQQLAADLSHV